MTSQPQVTLDAVQFVPRSESRTRQVCNSVLGRKFFKPNQGLNGQTTTYENNVPHEFFLNAHEVQMRTNQVQNRKLSVQTVKDQMRHKVRKLAEPLEAGESIKAQQNKVARRTGLSWVRVKKYWYGLVNDPPAVDFIKVANAYSAWLSQREARLSRELQELRNDVDALS